MSNFKKFKKVDSSQKFPEMEEEILKFWEDNKIFEKSLENRKNSKEYSFYDGPPFATGTPHYGHLVASLIKDVVPRYWTMRGYYVERKWGWDCHGLPIENIVEKEMGSQKKKDIEKLGVDKFNEMCRSKVLGYVDEWKKIIGRIGRWADMENAYKTMDLSYMESIWWVFKELWDKNLIYKDYRSMHICPRCETTLSQSEVAEGYKDIKDLSVIAKFEVSTNYESDTNIRITNDEAKTYILAWTTTPWTLIGNVALAVGEDIDYVKVKDMWYPKKDTKLEGLKTPEQNKRITEFYILEEDAFKKYKDNFQYCEPKIIDKFKGKDLIGKSYKPLFDVYAEDENLENRENGWKIYSADFVTTEEGTGIVHIAPAFGEDDLKLGQKEKLPFVQHVGLDGIIKDEIKDFAGLSVKPMTDEKNSHQKTDIEIIKYLAGKNLLFHKEKYEHSYPHCWRCDTPLINYATSSWFVSVTKIKENILKSAKEIDWSPAHMKEGRFGKWLEGARDWSISRQRFWASVMPIWECDKCEERKVFGSVAELKEASGVEVNDLHKHIVDKISFKCEKCDGEMKRIPDVLDTWFDSGSMPYAQKHYPFENKENFEKNFPADFIAEGVDQTRAWFYYLHVIANGVKEREAFKNVIVNGIVLAEDGKKMSKRLQNYPDPADLFDKYGADAIRYYLMSSPVVVAQNISFSEKEVEEVVRGMIRMLWNSYSFFVLYANIDKFEPTEFNPSKVKNLLDRWIVSELNMLIKKFNEYMENYELHKASRLLPKFVDNLSNWYIRRSRKRFWKSENDDDKKQAYATLHYVLVELSKVMAPFTPFIAEEIYKNLKTNQSADETKNEKRKTKISVHLTDFPIVNEKLIDKELNKKMENVREVITAGLQLRAQNQIKVRQPLASIVVKQDFDEELNKIIKEELNIKKIESSKKQEMSSASNIIWNEKEKIGLNTEITPELKLEGQAREIIRHIQQMRKKAGYAIDNRIQVCYSGMLEVFNKFGDLIAKETLTSSLEPLQKSDQEFDLVKEFEIDKEKLKIQIGFLK